ncbi:MAG: thiamine pyrophosphate-dependent enzyme [Patescibacteria group bacterium]|nr:thiamine pyrophosphate-dependent enzyme [Patescibacteria group bacterium]
MALFKKIKPEIPDSINKYNKPHKFCPGCGHGVALKELGFAIDEFKIKNDTLIGIDIGCSLLAWDFFGVKTVQTHHGRTVPVISGYKVAQPQKIGIVYMGDGGAYAIGLQALIHAAYRNTPITVIVINNTLYGMTGGQMAPTTLCLERTATTLNGRVCGTQKPFLGPEMLKDFACSSAYIARTSIDNPLDVREKIKKAIETQTNKNSFSFVEILSICPTNWKKNAHESLKYLKNEMMKNFKLGEINRGEND